MIAISRGHHQVVRKLLDCCAPCEPAMIEGSSALHEAVIAGKADTVRLLIERGADVLCKRTDVDATAFFAVCASGKIDLVIAMIETVEAYCSIELALAMLEASRLDGTTPLMAAAAGGHADVVEYIIKHRVSVRRFREGGYNAVFVAAQEGHARIVKTLLDRGADVKHANDKGETALLIPASRGHHDVVRLLIDRGAPVEARSRTNRTALLEACTSGQTEIVLTLLSGLEEGDAVNPRADINLQSVEGLTPLMLASTSCGAEAVQALLKYGAKLELQSDLGGTAIVFASHDGRYKNVKLLIDHGANVNAQGYDGFTALITAADSGHKEVCELLIASGADMTMQTGAGHTALHRAVHFNRHDCVDILVKSGMDINIEDDGGATAMYWAASIGDWALVKDFEHISGKKLLDNPMTGRNWPLSTLFEVYGIPLRHLERVDPPWFVDSSVITIASPITPPSRLALVAAKGAWLGCDVDVVEIISGGPDQPVNPLLFVDEVNRWMPLDHPHVLRMYGACHRDRQCFILERTERDGFKSFVSKNRDRMWQTLHQISLGLRYLHERVIIHGGLRGDVLRVGDDQMPRVGGFGRLLGLTRDRHNDFRWRAPEILADPTRSTFESDVYSFGMCIIEAVSGEMPYADTHDASKVEDLIKSNEGPPRHAAFTDTAWDLVQRMTCTRGKRLNMTDVVSELEILARKEKAHDVDRETRALSDPVDQLKEAERLCKTLETPAKEPHLLHRLKAVRDQVAFHDGDQQEKSTDREAYYVVLDAYVRELQRHNKATAASQIASNRQHATLVFSLQKDLDRIVEKQLINDVAAWAVWHQAWREWKQEMMVRLEKELRDMVVRVDQELCQNPAAVERLTCMLFELKKHRLYYSTIPSHTLRDVCSKIQSVLPEKLPEWFLPWYEVDIHHFISEGGFGEVYRGKWLDSDVVFKRLKPDVVRKNIDADFMREVGFWSTLQHPHIVKLFGACHVGMRVFVSEWAEHGELSMYLKEHHQVWQKLYEAALGLKYLHSRGVLHCDLKCNNILIGRDRKAKVADFGLSQLLVPTEGGELRTHGLVRWTAPEVLRGEQPSIAADIYSFGMCIIEAKTDSFPYAYHDERTVTASLNNGFFHEQPHEFVDDAQWDLVLRCCRPVPTERASIDEILTSLKKFAIECDGTDNEKARSDASGFSPDNATQSTSDYSASNDPDAHNRCTDSSSTPWSKASTDWNGDSYCSQAW